MTENTGQLYYTSTTRLLEATHELRYARRNINTGTLSEHSGIVSSRIGPRFVLQQAWRNPATGEVCWKDVPVVDEVSNEVLPTNALFFGRDR